MALDLEPMMVLSQKLTGGYHLSAQLQALLGRPMDSRGQEEAMAVSQELSRVFMEAMSVLRHANSNGVDVLRMAPEIMTGNSIGFRTDTKDKRISVQEVTPLKRSREEEFTRKEITPSPHNDGYQWRKYGQKNIQKSNFARCYYKCNRDPRCTAKKKVQQQDKSSDPPMFEVTYVNDHTCHAHVLPAMAANDSTSTTLPTTTSDTLKAADSARNGAFDMTFPHIGGGMVGENEAIVSCLAMVISGGTAPPPPPPSQAGSGDAPAYVPPPGSEFSSMADGVTTLDVVGFSCDDLSSFCHPLEAAGLFDLCDVHMDAARIMDTVWPRHT
ncbi:probable WRKY transcription factor 38 [Phragmites australis]|uniref:probable WRKY transcription factor 38 n=1 Tax=Phragmites australis TaxID=29695 RepID=UPI002D78EA64|nr:probable WRKY transcription factor 38 [Phragmites australis]